MKIAYIMKNYNAASELWLQRQIEMLKKNITFIAATDNTEKTWHNTIPVINLSRYSTFKKILEKFKILTKKPTTERYCEALTKALGANKVNVIFINYLSLSFDLKDVLLKTDLPIVIHTHGYDITWDLMSRETGKMVYDESYLHFARSISKKALFIANSNYSKNRIIEIGISTDRIVVKKFGVTVEGQKILNYKTAAIKILYIGRLIECKAPDLVIRAFELACERGLDSELIIAGGGNLEALCESLRERSKYKEKIKLLGFVSAEEGERLRSMCDIFTAHNCKSTTTNQIEAFGVSIIEAMAAGLPVVTGRSGGVVDSIIDGVTGFLVTPGDIEEHADKFLELANNPDLRISMGRKAIERIKKSFSLEGEKKSILEILRKL